MSQLSELAACAGSWRGSNRLYDPTTNRPEDSAATAKVSPVLGGRFLRLDYAWSYQGAPQEGSLLLGCVTKTGVLSAHWIDTWHMGEMVLACRGERRDGGALSLTGSYAVRPGPDWGWRIVLHPVEARALRLEMFNITPNGQEKIAVEASFGRE